MLIVITVDLGQCNFDIDGKSDLDTFGHLDIFKDA